MRNKILCILLTAIMLLTLIPITAFAANNAITNGTPESDSDKNHGYIAVDKETAAEDETVTITVNPEDGYQLKSLTVVPTGFVDLGIKDAEGKPLYWKETNLGANNASDPGDYYMWGATALMYSAVDHSKTSDAFTFVTENPYGDNYKNSWDARLGFYWNNVPFADGVFKNNDGERNVFTKYTTIDEYAKSGNPDNITALQPEDDAATAKNENWHTPTYDEFVALATNCVLVWTSDYNSTGNAGYIVYKAKNDADKGKANMNGTWKMWDAANSKYIANTGSEPTGYSTSDIHIFLPAAGYGNNTAIGSKNLAGCYCSSNLSDTNNHFVGAVNFAKTAFNIAYNYSRCYGFSIRPVMNFSGITPAQQTDGTYQFTMPGYAVTVTAEFAVTIADILPSNFPASDEDNSWCNSENNNVYIYKTDSNLVFNDSTENCYSVPLSSPLTKEENPEVSYVYSKDETKIQFNMTGDNNDELENIVVNDCTIPICRGTYYPPKPSHIHAFTYTASNGKVTATCTDGCTEGWGKTPLTLTLTDPADLVYDTNAKKCAFASGEADAWIAAGLELPTITYTAKSGSSLTNNNAINAGSYTASITVNTNKTASLDFEITKATPYIKTDPAPSDIELGQKLSDSALVGYAQVSETNTTDVAGLFKWAEPDTMPTIADSEVTLYDVTFTPIDETNYNIVTRQVKVTVNHTTHKPELVNGQAPTESAAGWKDYYKCICDGLFEDVNGTTQINDLAAWKAEGGNGYIAPLVHNPELVNGKDATETAAGYKAYYKCDNCGKYFEDEACTTEINDLEAWKAEGGNGYIAPLVHNPELVNGKDATETAAGYKAYYECDNCGKYFEDEACKTEINDLAAWKAEGGNGYIPKLEPADPTPEPEPINYKITQGANSIWVVAAGESPTFRSNAPFEKFSHVLLDGRKLHSSAYKGQSGSTLITLTPEYTATLAVGKHTIEIVSTDGSAATVFYIEETIADTNGEGFALSTATMSSLFVACNIVGLSAVFFEIKKKKKVR